MSDPQRPPVVWLQECRDCGRRWQTQLPGCPYCGSPAVDEGQFPGVGTVYSWIVACMALADPDAVVPYTVVTVELERGARLFGRYEADHEPTPGEHVVATGSQETPDAPVTFVPAEGGTGADAPTEDP